MVKKNPKKISEIIPTETVISRVNENPPATVESLQQICDEEGVTVRTVISGIKKGMDSDIIKLDTEGDELSRVPDMPTRHKYIQTAVEVLKLVGKDSIKPTINNTIIYQWKNSGR